MKISAHANVTILSEHDAYATISADLKHAGRVYAWTYLIDPKFAEIMLATHLAQNDVSLITDHRMTNRAQDLVTRNPGIHAWTWSNNRTLHDKTFIFEALNVVYIGTHNLTHGSYWLSRNRSIRIESSDLTDALLAEWLRDRASARPIRAKPKVEMP